MKALLSIVLLLAFGVGVWGNTPEQIAQWKAAAEKGEAWGQNNLGIAYKHGKGVPKDFKEAVKWLRMAAEQGHAHAQVNLGIAYDNGNGVPEDEGVLAMSRLVQPSEQYAIYFNTPKKAGEYPFICTFPGHWMIMRGILEIVEE